MALETVDERDAIQSVCIVVQATEFRDRSAVSHARGIVPHF